MMFLQEEEEAAEEVAGEATLMLFKEVAGDKMLSKASRRLRRISQHYEYDLGYNNQELGRSSSLVVESQHLKDRFSFKSNSEFLLQLPMIMLGKLTNK